LSYFLSQERWEKGPWVLKRRDGFQKNYCYYFFEKTFKEMFYSDFKSQISDHKRLDWNFVFSLPKKFVNLASLFLSFSILFLKEFPSDKLQNLAWYLQDKINLEKRNNFFVSRGKRTETKDSFWEQWFFEVICWGMKVDKCWKKVMS